MRDVPRVATLHHTHRPNEQDELWSTLSDIVSMVQSELTHTPIGALGERVSAGEREDSTTRSTHMKSWSAPTRLASARRLTLPGLLPPKERKGKLRSRKKFHLPINGPICGSVRVSLPRRVERRSLTHSEPKCKEAHRPGYVISGRVSAVLVLSLNLRELRREK